MNKLIKLPEVLGVQMQRDLKALAVVFGSDEQFDNDFPGVVTLHVDPDAEGLVV